MSKTQSDLLRELAELAGYTDAELREYFPDLALRCTAVVTCMGRLEHLKQSLPRLLEHTAMHVVVVDYSCPDGTGHWVSEHFGDNDRVYLIGCDGKEKFNKPAALNAGLARAAEMWGEWLCVLDADTLVNPGFWPWLCEHVERGSFYFIEGHASSRDVSGLLVMHSDDYTKSGGYDLRFEGWGCEDWDQRARLHFRCGLPYAEIPRKLAGGLAHSDQVREAHQVESMHESYKRNWKVLNRNVAEWTGRPLYELDARLVRPLFGGMW